VSGETVAAGKVLKRHKAGISCLAADGKYLVSADDSGTIVQWDAATLEPVATHAGAAAGVPVTCIAIRGDAIVAGYSDGHLRIFRAGANKGARYMEAEIAAHARCVTALAMHPSRLTFASVGEDAVLNVWSLPELAADPAGGRAKVLLDMTARIPDTILTGVQFASHGSAAAASVPHIVVSAYDSHHLRVFLGL
jgi:WD40 repeat protein